MNNLRASTKSTFVKILIAIPLLVLSVGLNVNAETTPTPKASPKPTDGGGGEGFSGCGRYDGDKYKDCVAFYNRDRSESCGTQKRAALEAKNQVEKACGEAGIGAGKDCYSQAKYCETASRDDETSSENNFSIFNSIGSAAGVDMNAANANKKTNQNGCPQYTGEQYRKRLKEINDELKDVKKDIADLKKEGTDLEKDTQKDMQETQKDVQEAQKEMQEKSHDVDDDTRKQMSDLSKEQGDLKKQLSATDQNIVSLRGKMSQSEADKADQMISLNDAMIKDTCVATYEKALYENQQSKLNRSLSFAEMKSIKQRMLNIYNTCILKYQQQRINILTKKEAEQADLKAQILAAQDDMQENQRGIDSAQSQSSQIQTAATAKKNEAQQAMATKIQTAQTSLQTAQSNMQKQQQNMQSRYKELTDRQNKLTTEMNAMGTEPDADATMTPKKTAAAIRGQMAIIGDYANSSCCINDDGTRKGDEMCSESKNPSAVYDKSKGSGAANQGTGSSQ